VITLIKVMYPSMYTILWSDVWDHHSY